MKIKLKQHFCRESQVCVTVTSWSIIAKEVLVFFQQSYLFINKCSFWLLIVNFCLRQTENIYLKYEISKKKIHTILQSVRYFSVKEINLYESIKLKGTIYQYGEFFFFYILIYILNSNIEICVLLETIQDLSVHLRSLHLHSHTLTQLIFPTKDHFYFFI